MSAPAFTRCGYAGHCVLWLAAVAPAQDPPAAAASERPLVALSAALGTPVHVLDALANAQTAARTAPPASPATPTPRRFAAVHDARFDGDGRLIELVVTAPHVDPRDLLPWRVLPAAAVRWHAPGPFWALVSPTLQLQELARLGAAPPRVPAAGTWLGSQLARATFGGTTDAAAVRPAADPPAPPPPLRLWLADDAQRLAFVGVPIPLATPQPPATHRYVAVPWSLVRITGTGDSLRLSLATTAALLAAAPECAADERPLEAALRARSHAHFGVEPPERRAPADPVPAAPGRRP